MSLILRGEDETLALGRKLAAACRGALVIYLRGPLGAGKTTLVRGLLRGLGHEGAVKSPTYTLVEPYECGGRPVFHLDLYRVADAEELDYLGLRELQGGNALLLIEWPERGEGWLLPADLIIDIDYQDGARRVEARALTAAGATAAAGLSPE